jgi:LAS superfamily LD-carboxypeptidase LdcB
MPLSPNFGGQVSGANKSKSGGGGAQLFPARVKEIVLQPSTNPNSIFAQNAGYNSIAYISFHPLKSVVDTPNNGNLIAAPLEINIRRIPLLNEVVLIMSSTDVMNEDQLKQKYYYLSGVNIWNSVHHNGFPDLQYLGATQKATNQVGYQSTQDGIVKKQDDAPKDLFLGNTFIENPEIRNLFPIEGDVMIEGRFGNSMRFSHTSRFPSQSVTSPWSSYGSNTKPITIIRNGQTKNVPAVKWTPIFESIDGDASSIYLTNGQEIQMTLASRNLASYGTVISSSASVVQIPNVLNQPQTQALVVTDNKQLELAVSQSTTNPALNTTLTTTAVTNAVSGSKTGVNNSSLTTPSPEANNNATTEKTPTAGPGSSKQKAIPESQVGPLTWLGEEILPLSFTSNYSQIEEDESQYWSKNPPPISIAPAVSQTLSNFISQNVPPSTSTTSTDTGGSGGVGGSSTLTPEQIEAAKAAAAKSGLDIITGTWQNNDGQSITLAYLGDQCLELEAAKAFTVMVAAASLDGVNISLNSGFRPPLQDVKGKTAKGVNVNFTSQYTLREKSRWRGFNNPKNCNNGVFDETARKSKSVGASCFHPATAPPFVSKHGNGIAADLNTGGFDAQRPDTSALTSVYVWMALNGWKYGFVRTVSTETWHFEYHPKDAKRGPYAGFKSGTADQNYQRTMAFKGKQINLASITV